MREAEHQEEHHRAARRTPEGAQNVCDILEARAEGGSSRRGHTRIQNRNPENGDDDLLFAGFRVPGNVMPDRIAVAPGRLKRESQSIRRTPSGDLNRQHVEDRTINVIN